MPAPYEREEVTIAPASPHQTMRIPVGTYGPPAGAQQSLPVFKPGPGFKGSYNAATGVAEAGGAARAPQAAPRISGVAPALQAAGAPGVAPGTTLPVTEVLPQGIQPYQYGGNAVNGQVAPGSLQTGYKFLDPNTGRESGFPTLQAAQAALGTAGTPQGVDQAKAALLERIRQVGGDTSQTNEAENRLLAPSAVAPTLAAPALDAGAGTNAMGSRGFAPNEKIEIIRGMDSQVYNTNPQGLSVDEVIREQLRDSIISNLSGGRSALDAKYQTDKSGQPHRLQTDFDTLNALEEQDRKAATPSLDVVKGERARELTQNPAGINDADRLLFAPKQTQAQKREVYNEEIRDQYGTVIGVSPHTYNPYDAAPTRTPLDLQGAPGAQQPAPVQAPPAAVAKLKKNPKLAAAFKLKYGYLPQGF